MSLKSKLICKLKFTNVFMQTQGGAVTASCHFFMYCTTGGLEPFHPLCAEIYHRLASTCVLLRASQKMLCATQLPHSLFDSRKGNVSALLTQLQRLCSFWVLCKATVFLQVEMQSSCSHLVWNSSFWILLSQMSDSQYLKELRWIQLVCPSSKLKSCRSATFCS